MIMKQITFKEKGIELKNPSLFLITILKIRKLREEMNRARAHRIVRRWGKKLDREIMKDVTT